MIKFYNLDNSQPYKYFAELYDEALGQGQDNIQAVCISSFNSETNLISSRFVNLKYVNKKLFYFYSNYQSNKANDFDTNEQVSLCFFWSKTNTQIRIQANIKKISNEESDLYFSNRNINKNALAIISKQSKPISDFSIIEERFQKALNQPDKLKSRPEYWGGYSLEPFYFEFWKGNENRLNHRIEYKLYNNEWSSQILQP